MPQPLEPVQRLPESPLPSALLVQQPIVSVHQPIPSEQQRSPMHHAPVVPLVVPVVPAVVPFVEPVVQHLLAVEPVEPFVFLPQHPAETVELLAPLQKMPLLRLLPCGMGLRSQEGQRPYSYTVDLSCSPYPHREHEWIHRL